MEVSIGSREVADFLVIPPYIISFGGRGSWQAMFVLLARKSHVALIRRNIISRLRQIIGVFLDGVRDDR